MAFAPKETLGGKMQTKRSSWTPLNHHLSNSQVSVKHSSITLLLVLPFSSGDASKHSRGLSFYVCSILQVFEERRNLVGKWVRNNIQYSGLLLLLPVQYSHTPPWLFTLALHQSVSQFDKWSDNQRKQVLQDFFSRCSVAQMKYLRQTLCTQVPEEALDFTSVLPRVICLYIFSFLDPRSLCRCAQVSNFNNPVRISS